MTVVKLLQTPSRASFIAFMHTVFLWWKRSSWVFSWYIDKLFEFPLIFFSSLPLDYFTVLKHSHGFVVKGYARSVWLFIFHQCFSLFIGISFKTGLEFTVLSTVPLSLVGWGSRKPSREGGGEEWEKQPWSSFLKHPTENYSPIFLTCSFYPLIREGAANIQIIFYL